MKTLMIQYTPRGERSNTKKLLDHFMAHVKGDTQILDLCKDMPDMFMPESISAYHIRNYNGKELNPPQKKTLKKMDEMTAQLKAADIVILAYPMYNFSFPAAVKAWFDSVMQKGETWDMGEKGFFGLLKGKKALIISTQGGAYKGDFAHFDHSVPLAKNEFAFMGFTDVEAVIAEGVNMSDDVTAILAKEKEKLSKIAKRWYG